MVALDSTLPADSINLGKKCQDVFKTTSQSTSQKTMISRVSTTAVKATLRRTAVRHLSSERPEPQQVDSLLQIGSRRIYDETHDAYRESVRNFYETKLVPFHEEWENKGEVPRELWQDAGANGMLAVTVPEEYGGMGLDCLFASVNWQEQSYAGTTGPGWALHSEIVAPYLVHYGSEEQKQEW